ncbi:MAG: 3',5'-cyclic-nucleotide phosphodiesterase [Acidobacteria bacterium]|nr:3',5'-cyclic-nucleotide phosphodiesterase [Acidobacteriota bacterium]
MRITVLGGYGGESEECRMTCLLIDGKVALDAGCLSRMLPVEEQRKVTSILLTHSHIDHTNSLPFFIDNVYGDGDCRIDIYSSPATIYAVRRHLFNNTFWPDFARLPNHLVPALRFHELRDERPVEIEGLRFTPIPTHHLVPTHGFLIERGSAAVLWSSDTGPTTRMWEIANSVPNLAAVFLETSFDNGMQRMADRAQHLTPRTMFAELRKLERSVPVILHHLKPPYIDKIHQEVEEMAHPDVSFIEQGKTYEF